MGWSISLSASNWPVLEDFGEVDARGTSRLLTVIGRLLLLLLCRVSEGPLWQCSTGMRKMLDGRAPVCCLVTLQERLLEYMRVLVQVVQHLLSRRETEICIVMTASDVPCT